MRFRSGKSGEGQWLRRFGVRHSEPLSLAFACGSIGTFSSLSSRHIRRNRRGKKESTQRHLTNEQLFEQLARATHRLSQVVVAFRDRGIRQRLSTWLTLERAVLPPFSTLDTKCPRCHATGKKIKTAHHAEPLRVARGVCRLKPQARATARFVR